VLSEAEGITFLWERTERVRPDRQTAETLAAMELAKELGYLPLALEQAAAYIAQKQTYFERYLPSYRKRQLQLLETHAPETGDYPLSVATTWQLNFEQVEQSNPAAADVLRLSAFLAADNIPCELLVQGAANLGEAVATALKDFQEDPVVLDEVLSALTQYSLIRRNPEAFCYSLHRLVQLVQRHNMSPEERTLWCDRAIAGLNDAFPNPEFENWKKCDRLISHIDALWTHQPTDSLSWAHVLYQASVYLYRQGRFNAAITYSEQLVQIQETQLGKDHSATALSLSSLANFYVAMGRYSEAEPLYWRSLQIAETQLGSNDFYVAYSLNGLAELYRELGRYNEAEPLYHRSLQIAELQLGSNHFHTATILNNLALFYQSMGRYDEAEPLYQRAFQIVETQKGADHPDTALILNNLAELYRLTERYGEAESLYRRALQIRETSLVQDHPDIALSLNNLAELYRLVGRYSEAEPLYWRSLQIRERQLGSEHSYTATNLNNLALLYHSMERYSEAEPLYWRALQIQEAQLVKDHPNTANSLNNLAGLYNSMKRYSEAEPLYLRTLEILVKCFPENHPYAQTTWNSFCHLIQQAVESDRTQELSSHPITQSLLQEIQAQDE
jgi:tetratricopeptide (TPR) repeat protein